METTYLTAEPGTLTASGGLRVGGARGKAKKGGPLMISSYSANRAKTF